MDRFDIWDAALLMLVGYVAIISLVRLMAARQRKVTSDLEAEARAEQDRQRREARKLAKAKKKEERRGHAA